MWRGSGNLAIHPDQPFALPRRLPTSAETGTDDAIPLPNVSSKILKKVIEYCEYHNEAEKKEGGARWEVAVGCNEGGVSGGGSGPGG